MQEGAGTYTLVAISMWTALTARQVKKTPYIFTTLRSFLQRKAKIINTNVCDWTFISCDAIFRKISHLLFSNYHLSLSTIDAFLYKFPE